MVKCDTCPNKAVRKMNSKNCEYVAEWFHGVYCRKCWKKQEAAMKAEYDKRIEKALEYKHELGHQ